MRMVNNVEKRKLTPICTLHYIKLVYRFLLFAAAVVTCLVATVNGFGETVNISKTEYWMLGVIWLVYVAEMACRFFPSKFESMGCQKQFKRNYKPTGESDPRLQSWKRTFAVALAWVALNGAIGGLYYAGILGKRALVLISLAYGVCDMICILFFCPFRVWFMKNRCCAVCRIYNWDFAMMFTPLVFIPSPYAWSLVGMSLLLLARWEITLRLHPERFSDRTNACVSCENCKEKLCQHKKYWTRRR